LAELENEFHARQQEAQAQNAAAVENNSEPSTSSSTTTTTPSSTTTPTGDTNSNDSNATTPKRTDDDDSFRAFVARKTLERIPQLPLSNSRVYFSLIADSVEPGKSASRAAFLRWLPRSPGVLSHPEMAGSLFDALLPLGPEADREAAVVSFAVFAAFTKKLDEVQRRGADSPDWQEYIRTFKISDDVPLINFVPRVVQQILPAHTGPEVIGSVFFTGEHLHFMPERTALVATNRRAWPIKSLTSVAVKSSGLLSTGCMLELHVDVGKESVDGKPLVVTLTFQKIKEKEMKATMGHYLDELRQAWRLASDDEVDQLAYSATGALPHLVRFAADNTQRCIAVQEALPPGTGLGLAGGGDLARLLLCRDRKRRPLLRRIDEQRRKKQPSASWNDTVGWLWTQVRTTRRLIDVVEEHEITELNLTEFKNDVVQFKDLLGKLFDWFDDLDDVFAWKQPVVSATSFFVLMWLAHHDLQWTVVPIFMLSRAAKIILIRVQQSAELERVFGKAEVDPGVDIGEILHSFSPSHSSSSSSSAAHSEKEKRNALLSSSEAKDAQPQGRIDRLKQMYTQLEEDLRVGKDKVIGVHRFIRDKNTVMLKMQTISEVAVPHLSLTFAFVIGALGGLMFWVPFRFYFMVIVVHLFTKDMYFRKDPSPIDHFYDAVPVREELDTYLKNNEMQRYLVEKRRKEREAAAEAAAAAAAAVQQAKDDK
jgi:hypothetical protein